MVPWATPSAWCTGCHVRGGVWMCTFGWGVAWGEGAHGLETLENGGLAHQTGSRGPWGHSPLVRAWGKQGFPGEKPLQSWVSGFKNAMERSNA